MTKINISDTSCWCLPAIPEREAKLHHFLFLLGFWYFLFHFMDVWAALTLCDCQIPSAVGWDKTGISARPHMVGRELETACLYQLTTRTFKGYINMPSVCRTCSCLAGPGHVRRYRIRGCMECLSSRLVDNMSSDRETLQNLLQWTPPLPPTSGMLLSLTAVLWCNNTTHEHWYWFGGLSWYLRLGAREKIKCTLS